jgi:hypothetical protein
MSPFDPKRSLKSRPFAPKRTSYTCSNARRLWCNRLRMQTRRIDDVRVPEDLAQSMAAWAAALVVFLAVSLGCPAAFAAEPSTGDVQPKRVLMLHSFGLRFKPWTDFAEILRSEMSRRSNVPIDFLDHMLLTARLDDDKSDIPFVDYLRALYAEPPPTSLSPSAHRPPISYSGIALAFFPRHRCCSPPSRHVGSNTTS